MRFTGTRELARQARLHKARGKHLLAQGDHWGGINAYLDSAKCSIEKAGIHQNRTLVALGICAAGILANAVRVWA